MKTILFEFSIPNFEEVYAIVDQEKQRLHFSVVNYRYNMTLNLAGDVKKQLEDYTKYGDTELNENIRIIGNKIIDELSGS